MTLHSGGEGGSIKRLGLLAAFSVVLGACSVVRFSERHFEGKFLRAELSECTLPIPDGVLRYWVGGSGTPVVLLHGFGGSAVWQWHGQVGPFAAEHRLVIPDLLYFGGSNSSVPRYGLGDQAAAVVALLDHLGIAQADVVGISYGGFVAWQLATIAPERVRKVVFVDSPGAVVERAEMDVTLHSLGVSSAAELVIPENADGIGRLMTLAYAKPPPTPGFVRRDVFKHLYQDRRVEKAALLSELEESGDRLRAEAPVLKHPSLVVWGADDPLFPVSLGRRLAEALSAPLVVIPKTRHAPNLEDPERFNEAVLGFLGG